MMTKPMKTLELHYNNINFMLCRIAQIELLFDTCICAYALNWFIENFLAQHNGQFPFFKVLG